MSREEKSRAPGTGSPLTRLEVCGYKSLCECRAVEVRPLTILAGANSSGKSSIMQPLLLLKQTIEATYDPGPLLINGANVRFTSATQLLSSCGESGRATSFSVGLGTGKTLTTISFCRESSGRLGIDHMTYQVQGKPDREIRLGMPSQDVVSVFEDRLFPGSLIASETFKEKYEYGMVRDRCFLSVGVFLAKASTPKPLITHFSPWGALEALIRQTIHVPGLRGSPVRAYPVTAFESAFPGTFEQYVASVIARWQEDSDSREIKALQTALQTLGLTWKVRAERLDDTQVGLQVGRLIRATRGGAHDTVDIADVGFGVSQVLPVLVALLVAQPDQVVYLEQPEIHLHPRAQLALATELANAAVRGVRVVAETHSAALLLGIQTLVAEGKLDPSLVSLNWFTRSESGMTQVIAAELDSDGSYGDWPEDFGDVMLQAQSRYLDAPLLAGKGA